MQSLSRLLILLAVIVQAIAISATPQTVVQRTYVTNLATGQPSVDPENPGNVPLQLHSNRPFDVTVEIQLSDPLHVNPTEMLHMGQIVCTYYDNRNNYYFALQSMDVGYGQHEFYTVPGKWYVAGAAPLGGSCNSLQLSDPTCKPCPQDSVYTDAAGCLPSPHGILFANSTYFPVGAKVGVGCQFQPDPNSRYPYYPTSQNTWTATVISAPPPPSPAPVPPINSQPFPTAVARPAASPPTTSSAGRSPANATNAPVPAPAPALANSTVTFSRVQPF